MLLLDIHFKIQKYLGHRNEEMGIIQTLIKRKLSYHSIYTGQNRLHWQGEEVTSNKEGKFTRIYNNYFNLNISNQDILACLSSMWNGGMYVLYILKLKIYKRQNILRYQKRMSF